MTTYLIYGITFAFAAAVQPGPLMTYLISRTLDKGWKSTMPAVFAPIISDIPIIALVLLVLSHVPENMIHLLRIPGGFFILYLAYSTFCSWRSREAAPTEVVVGSGVRSLRDAVVVNLLNPGPYLGWSLIMGPLFIEGWSVTPIYSIVLVAGFYITMTVTLAALILLFSFARSLGTGVTHALLGMSALALLLLGTYQIWMGIGFYL